MDETGLLDEEALVKRAKKNREAFGELYEIYYPKIFNFALKRTASVQIALDITSVTFLKAFKAIKNFNWRDVPFSAWLYRIASNEINDHFRRGKRGSVRLDEIEDLVDLHDFSEEIEKAEEELEKYDEFLRLHARISELPDKYQEVIILKFFEKKKIKEMVDILGKKEGTIKSLLHRGLDRLRELMS